MSEEDPSTSSFDVLSKRLEDALEKKPDEPMANGFLNDIYDDFIDIVRRPSTAIIEFYTHSCPYCRQIAPILDDLASDYKSKVYFAKINIEEVKSAAEAFDVEGVPLVIAFKKGQPVGRMEGLRSHGQLDEWINNVYKGFRPMSPESGPVTRITIDNL
ncbi:MAG: thioredoxin family protein [Candidatus Thorarchaeota archaeon]